MIEKISVIIPLYNKEAEIKRTINSVLSQTYQNFEIIVVDDQSIDKGPAIVKGVKDPRITLIEQEHRGVSYTRNQGVKLSTSDIIAFLDADDEWMPKHLETITRLIENHPEAGMFTTAIKIQTPAGKTRWMKYECIPDPPWEGIIPNFFKSGAVVGFPVQTSSVVIPKKIIHEMGGFPEGYWYGEDVDLFGKIALKYPVAFSWEVGALYHWDASNRARNRKIPLDYVEPFIKTARDALIKSEVPQEFTEYLNDYISRIEIVRARRNVQAGYPEIAQDILKQCNTKWHNDEKLKWLLLAKLPYPLYLFIRDVRRKLIKIVRKKQSVNNY
jgi:glycosyltransferase involved in cell wall biosynthesis